VVVWARSAQERVVEVVTAAAAAVFSKFYPYVYIPHFD
jgi:hypothetical protein